ncbi:hypothetical protein DEU56DRAFT_459671 [Suillus clintonianus]|uniref:uncharacterized protein n=1 Tax=Suillus clintonianus TaxID=1904413 RepID=UPI001B85E4CF|nr:uncharacterized protein DEU56DRAFT_459671 [Suillus clintonianus]KAG2131026.1 hypothetical protein DEU56DRAFT_459671 [Suillus clintonianus]
MNSSSGPLADHVVAYPPAAHAVPRGIVSSQPSSSSMLLYPSPQEEEKTHSPMRLRGGCIPCPGGGMCFIIPCPCCC